MTIEEQIQNLVGCLIIKAEFVMYKGMIEQLELTVNDGHKKHYKIILTGNANFHSKDDYLGIDIERIER